MVAKLKLGEIEVDVVLKNIKNVHLSVYPPNGRVRISAPSRMSLETIRVFAISKLDWIRKQQKKFQEQERETPREYFERESHFVWGKRHLLTVIESDSPSLIELKDNHMILSVPGGADAEQRQGIIEHWYRRQLKEAAAPLIAAWEHRMGVKVEQLFVRRMKTKWGSCNPRKHTIRLNTELAGRPLVYLEYLVVHEMAHLLEPTHNALFKKLMDRFIPNWRLLRQQLNRAPISHEDWEYK